MGGYAKREGASSGVLDPLEVHCVLLGRFALVVADVLCVNEDLAAAARQQVRRELGSVEDVWVCATHTHSGPELGCAPGGGVTPPSWRRAISDAAAAAARAAAARQRDSAGRFHTGELCDVGSRRGDDVGDARVSVDVVSCVDRDGRLFGVLAVVPVHPTVLPASSTAISGDLASAIRTSLRAALGSPWVVVATGAAGEISTRRTRRAQTADECRRLGAEAAEQIAALMRFAPTPIWECGTTAPAAARHRLALPARCEGGGDQVVALRAALEDEHARELRRGATAAARTIETTLQGLDVAQARRPARAVQLPLSAARLGRLALLGIGAEPFHSLGEALRARCAGPSVVLGYANGHAGYLPDTAAYAKTGYEALSSPFRRDAAATAVAALIDLLPDHPED
jgi:neutral ceramidase